MAGNRRGQFRNSLTFDIELASGGCRCPFAINECLGPQKIRVRKLRVDVLVKDRGVRGGRGFAIASLPLVWCLHERHIFCAYRKGQVSHGDYGVKIVVGIGVYEDNWEMSSLPDDCPTCTLGKQCDTCKNEGSAYALNTAPM